MPLQMSMTLESVSNPISDEKAYGRIEPETGI